MLETGVNRIIANDGLQHLNLSTLGILQRHSYMRDGRQRLKLWQILSVHDLESSSCILFCAAGHVHPHARSSLQNQFYKLLSLL